MGICGEKKKFILKKKTFESFSDPLLNQMDELCRKGKRICKERLYNFKKQYDCIIYKKNIVFYNQLACDKKQEFRVAIQRAQNILSEKEAFKNQIKKINIKDRFLFIYRANFKKISIELMDMEAEILLLERKQKDRLWKLKSEKLFRSKYTYKMTAILLYFITLFPLVIYKISYFFLWIFSWIFFLNLYQKEKNAYRMQVENGEENVKNRLRHVRRNYHLLLKKLKTRSWKQFNCQIHNMKVKNLLRKYCWTHRAYLKQIRIIHEIFPQLLKTDAFLCYLFQTKKNKQQFIDIIQKESKLCENNMKEFNERQHNIWLELIKLERLSKTKQAQEMMEGYIKEIQKLISHVDNFF